jgi:hypothetical protein
LVCHRELNLIVELKKERYLLHRLSLDELMPLVDGSSWVGGKRLQGNQTSININLIDIKVAFDRGAYMHVRKGAVRERTDVCGGRALAG